MGRAPVRPWLAPGRTAKTSLAVPAALAASQPCSAGSAPAGAASPALTASRGTGRAPERRTCCTPGRCSGCWAQHPSWGAGPPGEPCSAPGEDGVCVPTGRAKIGHSIPGLGWGGNSFKTPSCWHCPQQPHTPCSRLGTREGLEGPGQGGRSRPPLWLVLSCRRRVGGAVPVIRRVRANYSPKLAGFKGLCRHRWGWRGRAWLQLGVGLARWLACAGGSAQPPLHHRNLCPSLRLREMNPPPALQGFPSSRLKPLVDLAVAGLCAPRDLADRCRMRPGCVGQRDKAAYFQRCWRRRLLQL